MDDFVMGVPSINEPGQSELTTVEPVSINEPNLDMPTVTSIDPTTCVIGDPDFDLQVAGTGFDETSVIVFAGHEEPTTWDGDATLSTGITPSLFTSPDTVDVQVRNGTKLSNALAFTFTDAAGRGADPDELEDEIEQAEEEGDFKPTHRSHAPKRKVRKH
jgi:hypothetical protein